MKLLTTILALVLSFSLNAQTIPDPSNASALAILKASPELNAKLKAFKLTLSEVDFKFAGNQHRYSTQCEYIKDKLPHDYYVIEFLGTCKKNAQHEELSIRSTVEYRRSNTANSCKLDNSWKHVATQVWEPTNKNGVKSIANCDKLVIDYFKEKKENFNLKLNYGFNDVVSIKNFETVDIAKCPNGYDKLASNDGNDKKTSLVTVDVLEMKLNDDKNGIRALRWNKHILYVKTQNINGIEKIIGISNEDLASCNTYPPKLLFEARYDQKDYDTLYAGSKTLGFEGVYNKLNKIAKPSNAPEEMAKAYDNFNKLLIDILSEEKKLKAPERLKKYLGTKYDTGYDSFIAHFTKLANDGYGWNNGKIIDKNTIKYNYYGIKLMNKKTKGDRNINVGEAGFENGELKFKISTN